ncbi:hypothetical protein B0H11DRAFT_2024735 [Mycena galericulata]|nr:hypothetical protein B0H11DRAFT_2024735 [Mycena galericulata]
MWSKLLDWVVEPNNSQQPYPRWRQKIKLHRVPCAALEREAFTLSRTPCVDPSIERAHLRTRNALKEASARLWVVGVQFGAYYRNYSTKPVPAVRNFSPEWQKSSGQLMFDYDRKVICIQLGDASTGYLGCSAIHCTLYTVLYCRAESQSSRAKD